MHRYYKTNIENDVGCIFNFLYIFSVKKKVQSYFCLSTMMYKQPLVPDWKDCIYLLSSISTNMTRPLFYNVKISLNK